MYRTIVLCLIVSSSAMAQLPGSSFHLSFEEIDAATGLPVPNPNGIIEPGEAARISVAVGFTPLVGSPVSHAWLPPGNWSVHSLAAANIRITNTTFQDFGTWSDFQLAPGWGNSVGIVTAGGRHVVGIHPSQAAEGGNQSNPVVNIWQGTWVPLDFSPRIVPFVAWDSNIFSLTFLWAQETSTGSFYDVPAPELEGRVFIPVAPSPGAASPLAIGACFATRRRRRPERG